MSGVPQELVADLHIHSRFSRATSSEISPQSLFLWAQIKGIGLLGTGDCTHPLWFEELKGSLEESKEGLWTLPRELRDEVHRDVPASCRADVLFVFQTEISTIYKKAGKTRKIHHVILLPDPGSVERLMAALERVGNIRSDGRPILGLDSRDLLEITLEACPQAIFIPAHVWTPWFSVFGSRSGFDDIEECYGDLLPYVTALETGLSSDPEMNWRWSRLDTFQLVSNSDAHSPSKVGREANLLKGIESFSDLSRALSSGEGLLGTLEFFPEEGKYHLDGHRKCGIQWDPLTTRKEEGRCPVCGKAVTVGVMHRVEELCDRPRGSRPPNAKSFERLVGLEEIIAQVLNSGVGTKRVTSLYWKLIDRWGPELHILRKLPLEEMDRHGPPLLREAIRRMRAGEVHTDAGFDGQYGRILLFTPEEKMSLLGQGEFFPRERRSPSAQGAEESISKGDSALEAMQSPALTHTQAAIHAPPRTAAFNPRQREAVEHGLDPLIIIAGPGTGKTFVLTHRIAFLIRKGLANPHEILALTFTTRAASEMRQRLGELLARDGPIEALKVETIHAFGYEIIRTYWREMGLPSPPFLIDEQSRHRLIRRILSEEFQGIRFGSAASLLERLSQWKRQYTLEPAEEKSLIAQIAKLYDLSMRRMGALDYDDLLIIPMEALQQNESLRAAVQGRARFIFVDEFQDLSPLQIQFLKEITSPHCHLTIIGDPDQSIYGFRGAIPRQFVDMRRHLPGCRQIVLEENYRSSGVIVDAAKELIKRNKSLFPRILKAAMEDGPPIEVHHFAGQREEADFIADEIDTLMGGTSHFAQRRKKREIEELRDISFGDIGVLFRLHTLAAHIEESLSQAGIPFRRYGIEPIRQSPVAGTVLAALRWLADPSRDQDLLLLLDHPRFGLGREVQNRLQDLAGAHPGQLWERMKAPSLTSGIKSSRHFPLRRTVHTLEGLLARAGADSIDSLLNTVLDVLGEEASPEAEDRMVSLMLRSARQWKGNLLSFLDQWSLMDESDLYDPRADSVSLLTVHASKGLEFSVVFVAGCEEGVFPLEGNDEGEALEEERRLFYVAMTRAKRLLYLTCARSRKIYGKRALLEPSRFLSEIPRHHCAAGPKPPGRPARAARQLKLF